MAGGYKAAFRKVFALTGGPGGGKTALLQRVVGEAGLGERVAVLEEAIHGMRFVSMSPRAAEFQCALVAIQAATEEGLIRAFSGTGKRAIVCQRGTLDPRAFWMSFGNSRESFLEMTGRTAERSWVFGVGCWG